MGISGTEHSAENRRVGGKRDSHMELVLSMYDAPYGSICRQIGGEGLDESNRSVSRWR